MRGGGRPRGRLLFVFLSLVAVQVGDARVAVAQTGSRRVEPNAPHTRTDRRASARRKQAQEVKPWTIHVTVSNGLASNVNFDQEGRDA